MQQVGTRLQRLLGEPSSLQPGQYCVTPSLSIASDKIFVHVCCPDCGGIDVLGVKPSVHRGLGDPSWEWECPTITCPFFEPITLESWDAP